MGSARPRRDLGAIAGDAVLATFAYLVVTIGYLGWFTADFSRRVFDWDDDGIYRYRILGRSLVRVVESIIGNPLGDRLAKVPQGAVFGGEMFTAIFVVNLACFVATVVVLGVAIESLGFDRSRRSAIVFGCVCFISFGGFAVNHYDHLSTLLVLSTLLLCHRARPNLWVVMPLFVLATLTRETSLLVVPAFWCLSRHDVERREQWRRLTLIFGVVGSTVYALLRVGMGGTPQVVQGFAIDNNLQSPVRTGGLVLMALTYGSWSHVRRTLLPPNDRYLTLRRLFWKISVAYLVVCLIGASWFEIRLLTPLMLMDVWLWLEVTPADATARSGPLGRRLSPAPPAAG